MQPDVIANLPPVPATDGGYVPDDTETAAGKDEQDRSKATTSWKSQGHGQYSKTATPAQDVAKATASTTGSAPTPLVVPVTSPPVIVGQAREAEALEPTHDLRFHHEIGVANRAKKAALAAAFAEQKAEAVVEPTKQDDESNARSLEKALERMKIREDRETEKTTQQASTTAEAAPPAKRSRTESTHQPTPVTTSNCPGKHGLKIIRSTTAGWTCSVCFNEFPENTLLFNCILCKYDECETCAGEPGAKGYSEPSGANGGASGNRAANPEVEARSEPDPNVRSDPAVTEREAVRSVGGPVTSTKLELPSGSPVALGPMSGAPKPPQRPPPLFPRPPQGRH